MRRLKLRRPTKSKADAFACDGPRKRAIQAVIHSRVTQSRGGWVAGTGRYPGQPWQ
jgi:hypothetical protein